MKRLTQYKFKLELPLSRKEVFDIISRNTKYESKRLVLPKCFTTSEKKFIGRVNGISFAIAPIVSNGNGFLPLLLGEINEAENKVVIYVKTFMHKTNRVLFILFDLMSLFFLVAGLLILIFTNSPLGNSLQIIGFSIMFFIFGRILLYKAYRKTKATFINMFNDSI